MHNILILEDNNDDVELMRRELKAAGIEANIKHVDTKQAFIDAVRSWQPHLVLADYALPQFTGLEALALLKEHNVDIPFVLVSGAIGEETAVRIVQSGATDYVLKAHMVRLRDVARQTLEESQKRARAERERVEALNRLETSQQIPANLDQQTVFKILILEDEQEDVNLMEMHLSRDLKNYISQVVDTEEGFKKALVEFSPDLILVDFSLPNFDGLSALKVRQEMAPDVPFLFVSSIIGEDVAIESLKLGVTDYVMKHKMQRLFPAVKRALSESRERQLRKSTDLKLQEQVTRLEKTNKELEEARDQAHRALALKSQFVANISHEIRTPMSGVLGMAELLVMSDLDEESRVIAEHIYISAKSLMSIVNDILDFSKLEAGKVQLEKRAFCVPDLIDQVRQSIKPSATTKNLNLEISIDPQIPDQLIGDDGRIKQTLLNLAHNAIKFTNEGTVKILCSIDGRDATSLRAKFSIEDTGIGIPESAQNKLFVPFMQADNSTTRRYGGTGLGLSICKSLVILMSGDLGVTSSEGNGSTFWFTVPLQLVRSTATEECADSSHR